MEYIKSKNQKKYVREIISITEKRKKIINNPGMKLDDEYQKLCTVVLAEIFLFLVFFVIAKAFSSYVFAFLAGVWFLLDLFLCIRVIGFKKAIKSFPNKEDTHFDFDEEGILISKEAQKLKVYWDDYQCIRVYKYSVAFLPREAGGNPVIMSIENYENIMAVLEENHIEMQIIK